MKQLFIWLRALLTAIGRRGKRKSKEAKPLAEEYVQLFNEKVLGSTLADEVPTLLPNPMALWMPKHVQLDYKHGGCYGAIVLYERTYSFESLRRAINSRFKKYEVETFVASPNTGMWRVEEARSAIQLADDKDEETLVVLYACFVDAATMAEKMIELRSMSPAIFNDFPVDEFIGILQGGESEKNQTSELP